MGRSGPFSFRSRRGLRASLDGWLVLTSPPSYVPLASPETKDGTSSPLPPPSNGSLSLAQTQARSWREPWEPLSRPAGGIQTPQLPRRWRAGGGEKGPLFPGFWGGSYCQGCRTPEGTREGAWQPAGLPSCWLSLRGEGRELGREQSCEPGLIVFCVTLGDQLHPGASRGDGRAARLREAPAKQEEQQRRLQAGEG